MTWTRAQLTRLPAPQHDTQGSSTLTHCSAAGAPEHPCRRVATDSARYVGGRSPRRSLYYVARHDLPDITHQVATRAMVKALLLAMTCCFIPTNALGALLKRRDRLAKPEQVHLKEYKPFACDVAAPFAALARSGAWPPMATDTIFQTSRRALVRMTARDMSSTDASHDHGVTTWPDWKVRHYSVGAWSMPPLLAMRRSVCLQFACNTIQRHRQFALREEPDTTCVA